MKKFSFRLEPVLRLRELRVEAETARLHQVLLQQRRLELALESLNEDLSKATHFVYGLTEPTALDLRSLAVFRLGGETRLRQGREALERARVAVVEARQRLAIAERDHLTLEKLKTKQLKEWELQTQREIERTAQELWLLSHTKSF